MGKDELLDVITKIGTCEDDVERRTLLTGLTDSVSKVFDDYDLTKSQVETLNETIKDNNEKITKLRETNMDLFLRVTKEGSQGSQFEDSNDEEEPQKREFKDLFDDKGGLK